MLPQHFEDVYNQFLSKLFLSCPRREFYKSIIDIGIPIIFLLLINPHISSTYKYLSSLKCFVVQQSMSGPACFPYDLIMAQHQSIFSYFPFQKNCSGVSNHFNLL